MFQLIIGFLGRALLSIVFIFSSLHILFQWQVTEDFLHQVLTDWFPLVMGVYWLEAAVEWGLANTYLLLLLALLVNLIGGLCVFLGLWTRFGAFLLLGFFIPFTFIFHHFWDFVEPQRQIQMMHFMKNISIIGGLLFILARGKSDPSREADANTV